MAAAPTYIRFRPGYDILLLREVVAKNPETPADWEQVFTTLNGVIAEQTPGYTIRNVRNVRDRLKTLINAHKKQEMESLRA